MPGTPQSGTELFSKSQIAYSPSLLYESTWKRDYPVRRPERPYTGDYGWPLAPTSTGNDDSALKVKNAANGSLVHAASRVTVRPSTYTRESLGPRKGTPTSLDTWGLGAQPHA